MKLAQVEFSSHLLFNDVFNLLVTRKLFNSWQGLSQSAPQEWFWLLESMSKCHGVSVVYLVIPWHALPLICDSARFFNLCIPNVTPVCCQCLNGIKMWVITSGSVHKVICDNFVLRSVSLFAHFAASLHFDACPPCRHWKWVHVHLNESRGTSNNWHSSQYLECVVRREHVTEFNYYYLFVWFSFQILPSIVKRCGSPVRVSDVWR
jgi:hypothetical protein